MLSSIRIVLVEPAGPLNVGSVARVMKNMGLCQLVLVNPQCDRLSPEARQMAVHAADLLESAQEVASLSDALQGCHRAIATTGLDRTTLKVVLEPPRQVLPWLLSPSSAALSSTSTDGFAKLDDFATPQPVHLQSALIFGREDHGLTKEELNHAQRFLHIPSSPVYPSLNLAQAVAICCYELALAAQEKEDQTNHWQEFDREFLREKFSNGDRPIPSPATLDRLEGYYQQLESLLLRIGYLYPHTAMSRMEKFRRLFHRAYPSEAEVAMLRGVLSQMEWAIKNSSRIKDDL